MRMFVALPGAKPGQWALQFPAGTLARNVPSRWWDGRGTGTWWPRENKRHVRWWWRWWWSFSNLRSISYVPVYILLEHRCIYSIRRSICTHLFSTLSGLKGVHSFTLLQSPLLPKLILCNVSLLVIKTFWAIHPSLPYEIPFITFIFSKNFPIQLQYILLRSVNFHNIRWHAYVLKRCDLTYIVFSLDIPILQNHTRGKLPYVIVFFHFENIKFHTKKYHLREVLNYYFTLRTCTISRSSWTLVQSIQNR